MKKLLFLTLCSFATNVWALEAKLSPNPIMQGESTELIISSDKPVSVPENLKELTQDFMISGQQQRQSSQFINGVGSTTYEVAFVLFPLHQGEIKIPALKVGNEETSPLTLKILDNKKIGKAEKNLPILELTAEVSNTHPYEGQTIFYNLTLTDGQGIIDGEILPSKVDNAHLSPVGQDKATSVIKDGQRVREIKRSYTLTPDKSGKIDIPPTVFNGQVAYQETHPTNKHKFFGFADSDVLFGNILNTTRPVSFSSNPIVIDVQKKPSNISGWWLPSTKVELTADYQIPQIVQVGDTISGKYVLVAQDVNANDMPVPRLNESNDFRVYPQPEERTTTIQGNHLIGRVTVSFIIIPLKAGRMEIPKVSVGWFNTLTKKANQTVIPARPITVEQGEISPVISPATKEVSPNSKAENNLDQSPDKSNKIWIGMLLGGLISLAFGGILFLAIYLFKLHLKKKKGKPLPDFYPFK